MKHIKLLILTCVFCTTLKAYCQEKWSVNIETDPNTEKAIEIDGQKYSLYSKDSIAQNQSIPVNIYYYYNHFYLYKVSSADLNSSHKEEKISQNSANFAIALMKEMNIDVENANEKIKNMFQAKVKEASSLNEVNIDVKLLQK